MATSPQREPFRLTPKEWELKFRKAIAEDFETHEDPLIARLLADSDNTFEFVAAHVCRYVTEFWKEINESRRLYGADLRRDLVAAIQGQKRTIKLYEGQLARLNAAEVGEQSPILINCLGGLQMARVQLAQLEYMRERASKSFIIKSLGYAGDLQTLYSLYCLLRSRLGECSYETLATLIDCGYFVEGIEKEVNDPKNLENRLDGFRQNHPYLAEQTEAAASSIPHGKRRSS